MVTQIVLSTLWPYQDPMPPISSVIGWSPGARPGAIGQLPIWIRFPKRLVQHS